MKNKKIDWIEEAKAYRDFLTDPGEFTGTTQEEAKQYCKEELENIIALNGVGELFECEKILAKKLNINIKD